MIIACDCGRHFEIAVLPVSSGAPLAESRRGDLGGGVPPGDQSRRTPAALSRYRPSLGQRVLTLIVARGPMTTDAIWEESQSWANPPERSYVLRVMRELEQSRAIHWRADGRLAKWHVGTWEKQSKGA